MSYTSNSESTRLDVSLEKLISHAANYLYGIINAERIKEAYSDNAEDYRSLIALILDIKYQVDFTLITSSAEIQELYDKYRNSTASGSKIEIRTLMSLATYIYIYIHDQQIETGSKAAPGALAVFLAELLTIHTEVIPMYTCQDSATCDVLDRKQWINLLKSNPWLIAAVIISYIPGEFIMQMVHNHTPEIKGES